MLRPERERFAEVGFEIGGALARDPVEEIERDVVKADITESMEGAPDVVRPRPPLEHLEQLRLEALRPERHAGYARVAQREGELRRNRLRVRLYRNVIRAGQGFAQPYELA